MFMHEVLWIIEEFAVVLNFLNCILLEAIDLFMQVKCLELNLCVLRDLHKTCEFKLNFLDLNLLACLDDASLVDIG